MNLKQFLRPFDASFSTPKAARKLLHLFAIALIAGAFAGAFTALRGTFDNEISIRRSHMNQAIFEAQGFFVSRQTLLQSLVVSTVRNLSAPPVNRDQTPAEAVPITLSEGEQRWSLWLTKRMREYLRHYQVNLLYVADPHEPSTTRLFNTNASTAPVSDNVLQQLLARPRGSASVRDPLWFKDQTQGDAPLYVFARLDERTAGSGWLGLEIQTPDLIAALHYEGTGGFMLLDRHGKTLFSTATEPERYSHHQLQSNRSFGFVGLGWFPDKLAIRKQLDFSDWQIVYLVELRPLLQVLSLPLLLAVLLCAMFTGLMYRLVRRIERRLIIPASHRIEALVESEAFSRTVINIAPVALCVLRRRDGAVVLENPLARQWLGNGEERERLSRDWIKRAFDDAEQATTDEFERADGRHLYLSYAPTRYKREDVLICAFSDISARKQMERALEQARQCADAANDAKSLFLATMSHEIRTPLYGVLGTLELFARTELSRQQRNYLNAIEGSSANLLQLICDVLDVCKIEAGQLSLDLDRFSPVELTQAAVNSYAASAQTKGVLLFMCIDPQVPDWLNGDAPRIRQVLNNLLNNAVKFTDNGRIILRLRVDSRVADRVTLHWQVSDTGKGVSPEEQRFLFEPFYQGRGTTNVIAGTGLGLSICKRLMHLMDGTMRVVSEPGLGTSFTLHLQLQQLSSTSAHTGFKPLLAETVYVVSPVRELAESLSGWLHRWGARSQVICPHDSEQYYNPAAVLVEVHAERLCKGVVPGWVGPKIVVTAQEQVLEENAEHNYHVSLNSLQALHNAVSQAQGQSLQLLDSRTHTHATGRLGMHVLVAEDNPINQLILRDQLEELGCTVALARDGLEALALWRTTAFDLVLTDINMPRMNGYELAIQLRQHDRDTPIIGATANAQVEENDRCLRAGMNQCLIKPLTLYTLYNCLLSHLSASPSGIDQP